MKVRRKRKYAISRRDCKKSGVCQEINPEAGEALKLVGEGAAKHLSTCPQTRTCPVLALTHPTAELWKMYDAHGGAWGDRELETVPDVASSSGGSRNLGPTPTCTCTCTLQSLPMG